MIPLMSSMSSKRVKMIQISRKRLAIKTSTSLSFEVTKRVFCLTQIGTVVANKPYDEAYDISQDLSMVESYDARGDKGVEKVHVVHY